jgi:hypothetical protein
MVVHIGGTGLETCLRLYSQEDDLTFSVENGKVGIAVYNLYLQLPGFSTKQKYDPNAPGDACRKKFGFK